MRRRPAPLSVTNPPPSRTTSRRELRTFAVAPIRIVTGLDPHENLILPPARTAATTADEVQLRAVPCPITRAGAAEADRPRARARSRTLRRHHDASSRACYGPRTTLFAWPSAIARRGLSLSTSRCPRASSSGSTRRRSRRRRRQAGWTIERRGASIAVRDVWTENEDHAAWLVADQGGPAARARHRLGWSSGVARSRSPIARAAVRRPRPGSARRSRPAPRGRAGALAPAGSGRWRSEGPRPARRCGGP